MSFSSGAGNKSACLKSLAAKAAPAIPWMLWIASFATAADDKPITYEDRIAGIKKKHCATCHGDGKQEAGLSLVSSSGLMKGAGGVILPLSEHKKSVRSLSMRVAVSGDGTIILAGDSAGQLHAWPTK